MTFRHDPPEYVLDRLEAARATLDDEHGAEYDYFHYQYTRELGEHVLAIGFALLEANERMRRHIARCHREEK